MTDFQIRLKVQDKITLASAFPLSVYKEMPMIHYAYNSDDELLFFEMYMNCIIGYDVYVDFVYKLLAACQPRGMSGAECLMLGQMDAIRLYAKTAGREVPVVTDIVVLESTIRQFGIYKPLYNIMEDDVVRPVGRKDKHYDDAIQSIEFSKAYGVRTEPNFWSFPFAKAAVHKLGVEQEHMLIAL